jgi:demethylmenaquinone methyltransferase/2-methoxy-6-polyprenyl-1,4-benzoquinol methylase
LGEFFAQDAKSYQYLAESIRMHPDQEALCLELQKAGFEDVHYHNMSAGIVALHIGYKY